MALGEWNGNDNDRAFPMVGVPAYLSVRPTGLTREVVQSAFQDRAA